MRCPTLKELPPPPRGKTGWPWTKDSQQLLDMMPNGRPWPKISIVTPNYNYAQFIEETIRSVLLQGYPNLEYIIIDDGSTDRSVEVIKKYSKWLTYWERQDNHGQAHAINKGFTKASGDIFAWINSDDTYEKNAFYRIAKEFAAHPEADVISGVCRIWAGRKNDIMMEPNPLRSYEDFLRINSNWMSGRGMIQPETFFRRRAYELAGGLPESLYYAMDAALWIRMARKGCKFHSIPVHIANYRIHKMQSTGIEFYKLLRNWAELCGAAWNCLRQDWHAFGERAPLIADDIFKAAERLYNSFKEQFSTIRNSTSYRIGRSLVQLAFWKRWQGR